MWAAQGEARRAAAAGPGCVAAARPTVRHMAWYLAAPTLTYQERYPLAPRCARRMATCALPAPARLCTLAGSRTCGLFAWCGRPH